ncbi:carbohydrate ABC transporter permease [Wenxinia marina]|uniref:Carbohydrate ABC transporter membrane protein 1, CUT1 family n=1 Tax=Wenxinia marina DSM 24838 TaxID=1123501 RepID=A0A0D0QFK3_9RHOB|nr:sugar ABC transporter permease [Wenxinia marina]KIQ69778.1 carbohydrate ABC transporter membrane protein 1, CUT1 family [Wenxinia marina DSM 24838]GGL61116.1 sugar ABC transporter permease [Wenxinia marina]
MGTIRHRTGAVLAAPLVLLARLVDVPMRALQRRTGQGGMAAAFLLPNMAIFGVFVLVPLALNVVYSTTAGTDILLADRTYVGGQQYARLLECQDYARPITCREDQFWTAARNTGVFVVLQVTTMVVVSLITALILNREIRGRGFFRAVFFFPVLLSPVVVGLIWRWILQRQGLLNLIMVNLGLEPEVWLNDRTYAFGAAIGVSVWAHMGFYTLILLAGLQAIPKDLYEAAQMDGTGPARVFRRITLPLLMPNLAVVLVLALIRGVQIFDEVYVLTGGGPGTSTMFLTQYIYETGFASVLRNPGLAAAASILMGLVLVVLTLAQLWLSRRAEGRGVR